MVDTGHRNIALVNLKMAGDTADNRSNPAVRREPDWKKQLCKALITENVRAVDDILKKHPELANHRYVDERQPDFIATPLLYVCRKEGTVTFF